MKNILYNLDSIDVSYGDNVLNTVIQINERINDIVEQQEHIHSLNDFEKTQIAERLSKLIDLNRKIQRELAEQADKIAQLKGTIYNEVRDLA